MSTYANSSVISVVAFLPPAAGKVEDVRKRLIKVAENTHKHEKGCLRYELTEQADETGEPEFVVVEDYQDQAALDEHNNSEYLQEFSKAVQTENLMREGMSVKRLKKFGGFSER